MNTQTLTTATGNAQVSTFVLEGLTARSVCVDVDVSPGLPSFTIIGLADRAVRETRERVRAAIDNSGLPFPDGRITVNVAPASVRKTGSGYDLAIALGLLAAQQHLPAAALRHTAAYGELSVSGAIRQVRGALPAAESAATAGLQTIIVSPEDLEQSSLAAGVTPRAAHTLNEAVGALTGAAAPAAPYVAPRGDTALPDLADIRGHAHAIRGLTIAAAGGHNVLLLGPAGCGKTMLARRLPGILPPLDADEALQVARVRSAAGTFDGIPSVRPFRAPHHSVSVSGLIGGGPGGLTPGELSMSSGGVLFLDELEDLARPCAAALAAPLQDRVVVIVRGDRAVALPADVQLLASANACACGRDRPDCHCTQAELDRHRRRINTTLADRFDVVLNLTRTTEHELADAPVTTTAAAQDLVLLARGRQTDRYSGTATRVNAELDGTGGILKARARLTAETYSAIRELNHGGQVTRGAQTARLVRVARTIADLAASDTVEIEHLLDATQYAAGTPAR